MALNIVFLGAPGAGKGTQAQLLAERLGIPKLSTGDLLRDIVKEASELAEQAREVMQSGALFPDDLMLKVLKEHLLDAKCGKGFILDGFPRTLDQAMMLDKELGKIEKCLDFAMFLDVNIEALTQRIVNRFSCEKCGASYNKLLRKTKKENVCDFCGGTVFTSRKDDSEELVKARLEVFETQTLPIVDYYAKQGILHRFDGLQPIDTLYKEIEASLDLSC